MGWASGSGLAEEVWDLVRKHVPVRHRKRCALKVYHMFCEQDADDWDVTGDLLSDAGLAKACEECGTVYSTEYGDGCWECEPE